MNELLKVVLSLSLSGTLLILLLFLPRSLFKERLSKRWQYYIWLVVIARLLFPFAPETNLMARLFQGIDRPTEQMEIVSPYAQQSGIAKLHLLCDLHAPHCHGHHLRRFSVRQLRAIRKHDHARGGHLEKGYVDHRNRSGFEHHP